jgi:uncharacterized membrane protein
MLNINRIVSKYVPFILLILFLPVFSGCDKGSKATDESSTEPGTKPAVQNKNKDEINLKSDFLLDNSCKVDSDCTTVIKANANLKNN